MNSKICLTAWLCSLILAAPALYGQGEDTTSVARLLDRGEKFQAQKLYLAAAEDFARAFLLDSQNADIALKAAEAFDISGHPRAIGYYEKYLSLAPNGTDADRVKSRTAQLECMQLLNRGASNLVRLREFYHNKPGFAYQNANTPIHDFFTPEELKRSQTVYGRMIEYYVQAARTCPESFLPHARLMEIGLYTGSEALALGAAAYLQQRGWPVAFSANFYFGDDPLDCIESEQEANWSSPVTTLPDMHVLRRGLMLVDRDNVSFYDRPCAGWFVKDRATFTKFFDDYHSVAPLLSIQIQDITDIGHYLRENFWGDLFRWELHLHTIRWYDVPKIIEHQHNERSRTFLFASLDGVHIEARERLSFPLFYFRKHADSKQVHYSQNWSQRIALVLKKYTAVADAVKIDEAEKFHHEDRWFDIWCEPGKDLTLPKSVDAYASWIQNAPVRTIAQLEEETVAFNVAMQTELERRKFGRGGLFVR